MRTISTYITGILILLSAGTALSQKLSKTDLARMYSEYLFTRIEPVVFHESDDSSTVYLNVSLHHFQYVPDENGEKKASFRVSYKLYPSYDTKSVLEKGARVYSDTNFAGEEMQMAVDFKVKAPFPGTYVLLLELTDLNDPEKKATRVVDIDKQSRLSRQNFMIYDDSGYPVFGKFIVQDQYFKVYSNNPETKQLIIRYYNREFPIAKPPFAMEKNITYSFEPDSIYNVAVDSGFTGLLELPYAGIYHIQADLAQHEGITLYRFDEGFPEVNIPAMALAPLRYLSTEREFERLLSYRDYKTAVDSFWLERASNNATRAKNMIRKFYQRVVDVNLMFSSYQEGWKTDRGLIYIIYGPPSEVYRDEEEEEWIYGEKGNPMSIKFYFFKVENPFTNNDYSLQRSTLYKTSWYIAVENWRR